MVVKVFQVAAGRTVLQLVVSATVLFGYVPDHAVLEREPALARLARERLFFSVRAHVPAQVLGRVETVQAEGAQNLQDGEK